MRVKIIKEAKNCLSHDSNKKFKDKVACLQKQGHLNEELLSEWIDKSYLNSIGIAVGGELGKGKFGTVYNVVSDLGDGIKEYALKYIEAGAPGFRREERAYERIKGFVESANFRQDAEAVKISKILPTIYSVTKHQGNLYILMEKLIPLSSEEKKLFYNMINAAAKEFSVDSRSSSGTELLDYIDYYGGADKLVFDIDKARAIVKAIAVGPEFKDSIEDDPGWYASMIFKGAGDKSNLKKIMRAWKASPQGDETKWGAFKALYVNNDEFKKFLIGIGSVLEKAYYDRADPQATVFDDPGMIAMTMDVVFNIVFSQKYPMKHDSKGTDHAFSTGYGQSSKVWDYEMDDYSRNRLPIGRGWWNKKGREVKEANIYDKKSYKPIQKSKRMKKYPFDPIIQAIRQLGEDWDIIAKDMHALNVMKRASDGQFVVADVGLFGTKPPKQFSSGQFYESKRRIKIKIT